MIARDENEFELFSRMDQERYVEEDYEKRKEMVLKNCGKDKLPPNYNYRLIQDFEVPEWI